MIPVASASKYMYYSSSLDWACSGVYPVSALESIPCCVILEFGLKNSIECSMHYYILMTYMLFTQLLVLCVNGKTILRRLATYHTISEDQRSFLTGLY